ncbi:MAG: hypothetical protein AB8D52_02800 [Gammaproteobacteria bacterium]
MKIIKVFVAILSLGYFIPASADNNQEMTRVWQTDISGKPPYKRKMVQVPVVDLASFETKKTKAVNSADFSGKPPYKRNKETVRIVDLAQFEAINEKVESATSKKKFVPAPRRMKQR